MLHTKYQGSRPSGFKLEDFLCFQNLSLFKTCDPLEGPFSVVSLNIFLCFPNTGLCITYELQGGAIFGPMGIIWVKSGRGPLYDATYEITRF